MCPTSALRSSGHWREVASSIGVRPAEADCDPLPFDVDAARAFGQVAAALYRAGRKASARAYEVMIAATALANGLPLYTCNTGDFTGIDGLAVATVPHPEQAAPKG